MGLSKNIIFKNNTITICLSIICAILVTISMYLMKPVLIPFVFALFLFLVVSPIVDWLYIKLKVPKFLGVTLAYLIIVLSLFLIALTLSSSIRSFIEDGDAYVQQLVSLLDQLQVFLMKKGFSLDISALQNSLLDLPYLVWFRNLSGGIIGFLGNIFMVLIFSLFLLMGKRYRKSGGILNPEIQSRITRYLTTKLFTSSLTAFLVGLTLFTLDIQLWLLFTLFVFLLNFIPSVGSVIATFLPVPIAFLQFGVGPLFWLTLIIPGSIQIVIGNILDPKLMGENLGLHPAIVLLSLLFWGFIWGIPGMFLSVPITAIIKLILSRYPQTIIISDILEGKFK